MMIVGCVFFFCHAAYGSFGRIEIHHRLFCRQQTTNVCAALKTYPALRREVIFSKAL
jgi:hypothetical protein